MSFPARLHDHRGHATTFVGDGILAYFEAERLPPLAIGIHRGPGLAGLVGCRERMEYAFVGRTVNLAARVQSLTRINQVDILVTVTWAMRGETPSSASSASG